MKKLALLGLFLIFIGVILERQEDIVTLINTYLSPKIEEIELGEVNKYYRDYNFRFVQNTDNFIPSDKKDLINIYYTVINAGKDSFTFYCPEDYKNCIADVKALANDQSELSDINNYVHPYNGFLNVKTEYDSLGKVTIHITRLYSDEEIDKINKEIDRLLPIVIVGDDEYQNIKSIHDYIVNNTRYDSDRSDKGIINYKSDTAYGPLFEGYAICGGYTDLMELFLERLNIKSFKVSSDDHIWNAVKYKNTWYHLDLTWDDPVASDGNDYLDHNYFLIDTDTLLKIERTQHNFTKENYTELLNQ